MGLTAGQKCGSCSFALLPASISQRRAAVAGRTSITWDKAYICVENCLTNELPTAALQPYGRVCCALWLIKTCVFVVVVVGVVIPMAGPQRKSWPGRDSWWTLRRRTASRRCIWPPSTTTETWPRSSSKRWGVLFERSSVWNWSWFMVFVLASLEYCPEIHE